jgi:RNA polymerase sigma-70 factor, ECF subfamily
MVSRSDQELVRLLGRGDHRAFESVYERCRIPLFRFALHMSGSHAIADEITQDAFLFLLRNAQAYAPEKGPLLNFLIGVARNLVRRSQRSAGDDVSLEEDGVESMIQWPESSDTPLDAAIRRQSAATLQQALLEIPPGYREVIVLCDLQEMSYAEAAATLGIPLGTVRSRLHRGHIALLDQLSRRTMTERSGAKL